MAALKSRSLTTGALVLAGLAAAGVAVLGKSPENHVGQSVVADVPVLESPAPETDYAAQDIAPQALNEQTAATPPPENLDYDRRRLAMNGSAKEIGEARKNDRIGSFRTVKPPAVLDYSLNASKVAPKLGLKPGSDLELRRELVQTQSVSASETGPIEFIVKLKDRRLSDDLRKEFDKSPDAAARHLKTALGGGKIVQRGRLQGFTIGGEAILEFEGPSKVSEFATAHGEIQRALNAAPGVSYAEQNYTADINSAH